MDEILAKLAESCGIRPEAARRGLGAVLAFLKERLPDGLFAQVERALPGADGLVRAHEAGETPDGGGLLGAAVGMAGKLLGGAGGDAAKLTERLGRAGLDVGQISAFLPKVMELLRSSLPPEVAARIQEALGAAPTSAPAEGGA